MTDEKNTPAVELVSALERVHWARWRRAQNREDDYENLPEDMRNWLRYAVMGVVEDLASRGWRPTAASELGVDADAEIVIIGVDCIARGDVISYRGDHYRRTRGGELVLEPAEARMFLAFLDTIRSRPASEPDPAVGPWRTAAEVPDDVRFTAMSRPLRHTIFKRHGGMADEYAALNDPTPSGYRIWVEAAVDDLAPFVRADGALR